MLPIINYKHDSLNRLTEARCSKYDYDQPMYHAIGNRETQVHYSGLLTFMA